MAANPATTPPPDGTVGFGGGESPVKQSRPITVGRVAVWEAEGTLTSSTIDLDNPNFITEAPDTGLVYGRRGYDQEWVPVASNLGVPEAPVDGRTYTRDGQLQAWLPLPYLISEAPASGQGFVRNGLNNTWQPAFTQAAADGRYAPITTESFPEAPQDGIAYARRGWDRSWQPVATGTGLAEAPPTGLTYVRDGLNERWVLSFTQGQAQAQGDARYAPIATVSFPEAPKDGRTYNRNGAAQAWEPALTEVMALTLFAPIWTISFPEAPTDGRSYARRGADNSWQALPPVQNFVTDAPNDGNLYVRSGTAQVWVNVQTLDLDGGTWGP